MVGQAEEEGRKGGRGEEGGEVIQLMMIGTLSFQLLPLQMR